jgi:hypothetical protein
MPLSQFECVKRALANDMIEVCGKMDEYVEGKQIQFLSLEKNKEGSYDS